MIVEACVETLTEAIKAEQNGANRIELCSRLELNGLTPSAKLIDETCRRLSIPVMVMIRPRSGNFVYSEEEVCQMEKKIAIVKNLGAAGIVFGLLTPDNQVDVVYTRRLSKAASPLPVTFHKAIDELENPVKGVRILKKIKGIKRILTSGGKATAKESAEILRKMQEVAGENLIILVAGKVTDENLEEIQQLTGAKEFHGRRVVGDLGGSEQSQ